MSLNLSELKELMSPLTEMCKKEKTISLVGTSVTLRILTPIQETEVQKLLPDITEDASFAMEFADVFRRETLSRAIVQVNSMDLRNLKDIETGEKTPSGVPIKISRQEAVLKVIESWSRPVISKIFEAYTTLSEEIESEMDESLKLNVEDTEATSEQLKQRAEEIVRPQNLDSISEDSNEQTVL
jgi:hypothetical protein